MPRPKRMILAPDRTIRVFITSEVAGPREQYVLTLYNVHAKEVFDEFVAFLKEQGYVHVDFLEPKEKMSP